MVAFEQQVQTKRQQFNDSSIVGLSARAFELGESLAKFRNGFEIPDGVTIAELKAMYKVLLDRFHQSYFASHARLDEESLRVSVIDDQSIEAKKRLTANTPPDVKVMIDIYNAIWNIHYQNFLQDPAEAVADWDVMDAYQTRAIRAVLHDLPYAQLITLGCMMLMSCEDTDKNLPVYETIAAKQELIIAIIGARDETPAVVCHRLKRGKLKERLLVLKTLLSGLQSQADTGTRDNVTAFPLSSVG